MRRGVRLLAMIAVILGLGVAPAAADSAAQWSTPIVLISADGLQNSDLTERDTPHILDLVDLGAIGSLSVRSAVSKSCPLDGWLTLSAGRRTAGPEERTEEGGCPPIDPTMAGSKIAAWPGYEKAAETEQYDATIGLLGSRLQSAQGCVDVVGPGAAIGGASTSGTVRGSKEGDCPVTLVDAGLLPLEPDPRAKALKSLDSLVANYDPNAATIIVTSVADGVSAVRVRAIVAAGPGVPAGYLSSSSTRQPGLVTIQDVSATLLAAAGADTSGTTGAPIQVEPSDAKGEVRLADRDNFQVRASTMRSLSAPFWLWMGLGLIAWAGLIWWRVRAGREPLDDRTRTLGLVVATVPISTVIANLCPWWLAGDWSAPAFLAVAALAVSLLVALERAATARLGGLRVLSAVTLVVLVGDVVTGSRLQMASIFGQNPVVGGRFYGFGNTTFALYAAAGIVVVAWIAGARAPRRAGIALAVLLALLAVEAAPTLGADFGGPPGLFLGGMCVLALSLGVRITAARAALAAAVAGGGILLVAWLDYLRPVSARTHLGAFVDTVMNGGAGSILTRKFDQNLSNLTSIPLLLTMLGGVAALIIVSRAGYRLSPQARHIAWGVGVAGVVGFLLNDSGIVIPAYLLAVVVPGLLDPPMARISAPLPDSDSGPDPDDLGEDREPAPRPATAAG